MDRKCMCDVRDLVGEPNARRVPEIRLKIKGPECPGPWMSSQRN